MFTPIDPIGTLGEALNAITLASKCQRDKPLMCYGRSTKV